MATGCTSHVGFAKYVVKFYFWAFELPVNAIKMQLIEKTVKAKVLKKEL